MSEVQSDLKYARSHEWVRVEGDEAVVGISDHAQELLGDLVFVELPEVGSNVDAGDEIAVVESVKAASDVYSPIGGEVIAVNEELADAPEVINDNPYDEGWIFKIKLADASELEGLMSAEDYAAHAESEDH
ncbi:MAG: glycine cleavage system protein GcvH [bacterium]